MKQTRLLHRLLAMFVACVLVCATAVPVATATNTGTDSLDEWEHYDATETLDGTDSNEGVIYNPLDDPDQVGSKEDIPPDNTSTGVDPGNNGADTVVKPDSTDSPSTFSPPAEDEIVLPTPGNQLVQLVLELTNTVYGAFSGDQFRFTLSCVSVSAGCTLPSSKVLDVYGTSTSSFAPVVFTRAGEWDLEIKQTIPASPNKDITYDTRYYRVHVKVAADADSGQLIATTTYTLHEDDVARAAESIQFVQLHRVESSDSATTARWANVLWDQMSDVERVGQLFLIHYPGDGSGTEADVRSIVKTYAPGGIISFAPLFGSGGRDSATVNSVATVKAKLDAANAVSKIPLMHSIDEEGGNVVRAGYYYKFLNEYYNGAGVTFPSALELWSDKEAEAIYQDALVKAAMLKDLGFNLNHAPVADVPMATTGYMYKRERVYSTNPHEVATCIDAVIRGHSEQGVGTTLKHFPGYCDPSGDTHLGIVHNGAGQEHLFFEDLVPFYAGFQAGGGAVMVTHNIIDCVDSINPASVSPAVYQLLREQIGFKGLAISDDLAMQGVIQAVNGKAVSLAALEAGVDMVIVPSTGSSVLSLDAEFSAVRNAYDNDVEFQQVVKEKVLRILSWKIEHAVIDVSTLKDPVETEAPSTAEAVWISANGMQRVYGTLQECFVLCIQRGGVARLLKDVTLGPQDNINFTSWDVDGRTASLDLNGHCLDFSKTSGFRFSNIKLNLTSTGSGIHSSSIAVESEQDPAYKWDAGSRRLQYYTEDSDANMSGTQVDFNGLGRIVDRGTNPLFNNVSLTADNVHFDVDILTPTTIYKGALQFSDCLVTSKGEATFKGNTLPVSFSGCYFVATSGLRVVAGSTAPFDVSDCVFVGTNGIYTYTSDSAVTVTDSLFVFSKSDAFEIKGGTKTVNISGCDILYSKGYAIKAESANEFWSPVVVADTNIAYNEGAISIDRGGNLTISDCRIYDNQYGVIVSTINSYAKLSSVKFSGNSFIRGSSSGSAEGGTRGGALHLKGAYMPVTFGGSLNVTDNYSAGFGGGIALIDVTATITGTVQVSNNAALRNGGGIYTSAATLIVDGRLYCIQNEAGANGGGIDMDTSTFTIHKSAVVDMSVNTAGGNGGALYVVSSTTNNEGDVQFNTNTATKGSGGAIYFVRGTFGNKGTMSISNNSSYGSGGGMFADSGTVTLSGTTVVSGNTAQGRLQSRPGLGGGICSENCDFTLKGIADIGYNNAVTGGGVYATQTITCGDDIAIHHNTASQDAGGMYFKGSANTLTQVGNLLIAYNNAQGSGGGLFLNGVHAAMRGVYTIKGNTAKLGSGGGIYVETSALKPLKVDLVGTGLLQWNVAGKDGGGLCANNCQLSLDGNNIIEDNKCSRRGGGVSYNAEAVSSDTDFIALYNTIRIRRNESGFGYNGSGVFANVSDIRMRGIVRIIDNVRYDKNGEALSGGLAVKDSSAVSIDGALSDDSHIMINPIFFNQDRVTVAVDTCDTPLDNTKWSEIFVSSDSRYLTYVEGRNVILSMWKESTIPYTVYVDDALVSVVASTKLYHTEEGGWALKIDAGGLPEALKPYTENLATSNEYLFAVFEGDTLVDLQVIMANRAGVINLPSDSESVRVQLLSHNVPFNDNLEEFTLATAFYSVFIDDVYGIQQEGLEPIRGTYFLPVGSEFELTLPLREGGSGWSVNDDTDRFGFVTSIKDKQQTLSFDDIRGPVIITSGVSGAVTFTVQQYTYSQTFDKSDVSVNGTFPVIDTSGRRLPVNGTEASANSSGFNYGKYTFNFINLQRNADGSVARSKSLSANQKDMMFICYDKLNFVDRTMDEGFLDKGHSYILSEIWVLKDRNDDPSNLDESRWTIWREGDNGISLRDVVFTSKQAIAAEQGAHLLQPNDVVRLVYDVSGETDVKVPVTFYDYDISDGVNGSSKSLTTGANGINSESNYAFSGRSTGACFAFGNANTGVKWRQDMLPEMYNVDGGKVTGGWTLATQGRLNAFNNNNFNGAIFGLVTGLDSNGNLIYRDGVSPLPLFGEDLYQPIDVKGKTRITDMSLVFDRVGDTYTLEGVHNNTSNKAVLTDLSKFSAIKDWKIVYSNLFWPLDNYYSDYTGHDPATLGLKSAGWTFSGTSPRTNINSINSSISNGVNDGSMPLSDGYGATAHNFYFGMDFAIDFELTESYAGDLEFCFFGDDDLWVFLDDQLICDIGGVHRSMGMYANLWDYIEPEDVGTHSIKVFYLERGGSGSTCWMQLTAPNAQFLNLSNQDPVGAFTLTKEVETYGVEVDADKVYDFTLSHDAKTAIPYVITDAEGVTVDRGTVLSEETAVISLQAGHTASFSQVPAGKSVYIAEAQYDCKVDVSFDGEFGSVNHAGDSLLSEIKVAQGQVGKITYTNTFSNTDRMPSTGGVGTTAFSIIGCICLLGATLFILKRKQTA